MKRWAYCCLLSSIVVLLTLDVLLLRDNHRLTLQIASLQHTDGPAIGQSMTSLSGTDLSGASISVPLGQHGRKTLILVYTPTCRFCLANWPSWSTLIQTLNGRAQIVWGDLSGTASKEDLQRHGVDLDGSKELRVGPESRDIYALHVTPTTILVGHDGRVEGLWLGVLSLKDVNDITGRIQ